MICVAMVCLCGCPLGTPRDHYRPPGHLDTTFTVSPMDDAILFNAVGTGGRDLYLLELTDLKVTLIAETPDYETAASFSPDGLRIAYAAGVPGDRADHIFTIQADGSEKTQLTDIDANDTSPQFSPDGKTIVFARDKTYIWGGLAANWELGGVICLIDADGANLRQLTSDEDFAFEPYFIADGTRVIYSTVNGRMSIPLDGSAAPQPLAGPSGAVPSCDGKALAYSKGKYSPDLKIYMANADATSERVLTPDMGGCYRPMFTHTGDRLFFLHAEWPDGLTGDPTYGLWEITVDGPSVRMLTDRGLLDAPLSWKPQTTP
jgi:Tol biopolymer transport system component